MDFTEREKIIDLFTTWLRPYTHEAILKVLKRRDEIINNEFAMKLLDELHARSVKEAHDFRFSIDCLLDDFDGFAEFDPHNHAISHAGSYRDVLYDMYIR